MERLLRSWGQWGRKEAREQLSRNLVRVNGEIVSEASRLVGPFDRVQWQDSLVQAREARYLMLHKPLGVVSATTDSKHRTVIDLVEEDWADELHLAGRLDRFTSGLMVLTNDSRFSEALTEPRRKLGKRYRVRCDGPITEEVIRAFEEGICFAKEKMTTHPAQVELLSSEECLLTIYEGKHHQVKRMFAGFDLKVMALHREAMGSLELDEGLAEGQWRHLGEKDISGVYLETKEGAPRGLA